MMDTPQFVVFDLKWEINEFMTEVAPLFSRPKYPFSPQRLLELSLDQILTNRCQDDLPILSLYKNAQIAMNTYVPKNPAVPTGQVSNDRLRYWCAVTCMASGIDECITRNRMRQNGEFHYGFEKVAANGLVVLSLLWSVNNRPLLKEAS